jgi:quercetin dioxygenase-like cupin family protein
MARRVRRRFQRDPLAAGVPRRVGDIASSFPGEGPSRRSSREWTGDGFEQQQEIDIMKRMPVTGPGLVLITGITASTLGFLGVSAQEKKEPYLPTAALQTLVEKPLHGVDGKQVTILHGSFPAGWVGGKHYHTGPVYVYVLEGSFTVEEQGKPRQTFTAGQLYEEPIGTPMQARNIGTSEQLRILLFQVHAPGEPLAYRVE